MGKGLKETNLLHVTRFQECPSVGKGKKRKCQEEARRRKHEKVWSRLACSRLRNLCLSSLTEEEEEVGREICCSIIPFSLGRLPAPCQHLNDIVRIGSKDKTMRSGARFQRRGATTSNPRQDMEMQRLFDQLQIIDKQSSYHLLHKLCKYILCAKLTTLAQLSLFFAFSIEIESLSEAS